jgi:hypothetical protein
VTSCMQQASRPCLLQAVTSICFTCCRDAGVELSVHSYFYYLIWKGYHDIYSFIYVKDKILITMICRQNSVEEIDNMDVSFKNYSIRSSLSSLYKNKVVLNCWSSVCAVNLMPSVTFLVVSTLYKLLVMARVALMMDKRTTTPVIFSMSKWKS